MSRPPTKRRVTVSGLSRATTGEAAHRHLALAEMLGMLSHEMRSPLQTLSASLDTVDLELVDIQSPVVRKHLERMRSALDKATVRLNSLSDYARTANRLSHQAVRIEDIALRPLLDDVACEFRAADARRVVVEVADNVPESLPVDKSRLQQVIENYLKNASKYCPTGDLRIVVQRVGIGAPARRREGIEFAVVDQGEGIADDEVALIWQPFYRVRKAADKPGSGLGLAIVQLLCDRAGWEAGYRRADGDGACFYVRVPLSSPAEKRPGGERRRQAAR